MIVPHSTVMVLFVEGLNEALLLKEGAKLLFVVGQFCMLIFLFQAAEGIQRKANSIGIIRCLSKDPCRRKTKVFVWIQGNVETANYHWHECRRESLIVIHIREAGNRSPLGKSGHSPRTCSMSSSDTRWRLKVSVMPT